MPKRAAFLTATAAATLATAAGASARRLGTVGMIKPTHAPGSLEDISLFLQPGVAMDPVYLGVTRGTRAEFASAIPAYEKLVALLADQRCDVITPLARDQSPIYAKYFNDAGFTVLGMEGLDGAFSKVKSVPSAQVAATIRKSVANHPGAQAVYILGSEWRTVDIMDALERELGVPILNPVIARAWEIQKRLGLHWPVKGYGRLIAELP